jgi:D-alanyl-D-alanine-carboxypeptidase/D-alanyl-D-alanine-endopeptidase
MCLSLRRRAAFALLAGLVPGDRTVAAQAFPSDSTILAILKQRVTENRSTGIVVGLLEPNGQTRILAYGSPGPGKLPLDGNSVFEIGSITKVFTGTVLAQMVLEGKVSLDDPVSKFVPPGVRVPERNGKVITLGHLSVQNSGLPRMPTNFRPKDAANPYADYTVQQMYDFLSAWSLTRDPGAEFEYSNLGVGLLGHVLARVDDKPYEQMVRDRILVPLKMRNTAIALTPWMNEHLALGHNANGDVTANWDLPTFAGAGALRASANDMMNFVAAAADTTKGPLAKAMALAQRRRASAGAPQAQIGLNWITRFTANDTIVWHNGGTGGYRTFAGVSPRRRLGVVVLTNSGGAGADDIGFHLLDRSLPLASAPAPVRQRTAIAADPGVLARYVGQYRLAPGVVFDIALAGDTLTAQLGSQGRLRVWPESDSTFFYREVDAQITFLRDSNRAVTGLILHQNGRNQTAMKIR